MTILQLEYFRDLAKTGSIVQTAQNFYISQPAVSKALKKLEEELGGELFDRIGKSIHLNAKGEEFYRGVNTIFSIIERNKADALYTAAPQEICIRYKASISFLADLLGRYSRLHPSVSFRIISSTQAQHFDPRYTVDFSFARKLSQIESGYYVPLPPVPVYAFLVLPPGHPLSSHAFITFEDLCQQEEPLSFVLVLPDSESRPTEYVSMLNWGLQPKISVITNDRFSMLTLVAQGGMAAIMPYTDGVFLTQYTSLPAIPLFRTRPEHAAEEKSSHYLFWDAQKPLSEPCQDFLDFLLHSFGLTQGNICLKK